VEISMNRPLYLTSADFDEGNDYSTTSIMRTVNDSSDRKLWDCRLCSAGTHALVTLGTFPSWLGAVDNELQDKES